MYQLSLKQGRTDSATVEARGKAELLNFYSNVSTAKVSSIKRIVYSKEHAINYVQQTVNIEPFYSKLEILLESKSFAKTIVLYKVKKSFIEKELIKDLKRLTINGQKVISVPCINIYK